MKKVVWANLLYRLVLHQDGTANFEKFQKEGVFIGAWLPLFDETVIDKRIALEALACEMAQETFTLEPEA